MPGNRRGKHLSENLNTSRKTDESSSECIANVNKGRKRAATKETKIDRANKVKKSKKTKSQHDSERENESLDNSQNSNSSSKTTNRRSRS